MIIGLGGLLSAVGVYAGFIARVVPTTEGYALYAVIILVGVMLAWQGFATYRSNGGRPTRLSVSERGVSLTGGNPSTEFQRRWDDHRFRVILQDLSSLPSAQRDPSRIQYKLIFRTGGLSTSAYVPLPKEAYGAVLDEATYQGMNLVSNELVGTKLVTITP